VGVACAAQLAQMRPGVEDCCMHSKQLPARVSLIERSVTIADQTSHCCNKQALLLCVGAQVRQAAGPAVPPARAQHPGEAMWHPGLRVLHTGRCWRRGLRSHLHVTAASA
jgi:hypothetical protein